MASKAGMPVLKRRLQEKLQTLRQCEGDLSLSVSTRRGQHDAFVRQKKEVLSQVHVEFDRLSATIEKKRQEVTAAVESEMEDHYQRSVRDWRGTEDLQGKLELCLQEAQSLLSCVDRSLFLSTYSSINQRVEDVLLEVLMALETVETSADVQATQQTSFQLMFSLASVTQLLLATKASLNVVSGTHESPSSPRGPRRNNTDDSWMAGDGQGTTSTPPATKGVEKFEDCSVTSSSTYTPSSLHSSQASQHLDSRGPASSPTVKSHSPTPLTQQRNMGSKMATPQLRLLQLKLHSTLQVLVTEVRSLEQFWVQPLTPDLEKLTHEMREYFSLRKTGRKDLYSTPSSIPARGSYCCAQFTADDEWYRAKVVDVGKPTPHSAPLMKVFYVDYGNEELQPLNRLRSLPTHLCSLPMQAISCSLAEVDSARLSKKAISWFQEYIPGQVATIEVVELATQFCYLVQCQVVPAQLEGLDTGTAKQLRNRNLVDVLYVMQCMSGSVQEVQTRAPLQEGSASSSVHHSSKWEAPDGGVMHGDSTSYEQEGRGTNPMASFADNSRTMANAPVEEMSRRGQLVVSATLSVVPDSAAVSPSMEEKSCQEQLLSATVPLVVPRSSKGQSPDMQQQTGTAPLQPAEDCAIPDKGTGVHQVESVRGGGRLEEGSVDLSTSGTELSMDLPPNVPSQDENDGRRAGSCGSLPSVTVEDVGMKLSISSLDNIKDSALRTSPTLSDLTTREIPIKDNSFTLIVSNIISPSLFYAHVVSPDSSNLDLLQQQINMYYGAPDNSVLLGCPPLSPSLSEEGEVSITKDHWSAGGTGPLFKVGSMCAAKLPEDGCWYRGVVIGVSEGEENGVMMEERADGEGTIEVVKVKEVGEEEKGRELEGHRNSTKKEVTEEREETGKFGGHGEGIKEEVQEGRVMEERDRVRQSNEKKGNISRQAKCRCTQYHVHYVDYGDAAWVSNDQICPLHEQFLTTPMQTVRLSLVGVAPAIIPPTPSEQLASSPLVSDEAMKSSPVGSPKMVKAELQSSKKKKKKKRVKRSRSKLSCNVLPAGGEPEEDDHQGCFELRSPSDSQLKDVPKPSLQAAVLYSSAPDICQRLQGSQSNVSEASSGLDQTFRPTEEERDVVMWSKEAIAAFRDLAGEQVLLAMVLEEDLSLCSRVDALAIKLPSVMDVLPVMLYDTTTDVDVFINGVLVERGLARIDDTSLSRDDASNTQPLSPSLPGLDDWDPLRHHFLTQVNDYERSLAAQNEKRVQICHKFNSRRGCSRGNRCSYVHAPIGPFSDVKTLESASPNLRLFQVLPPPHTWVAVEVITVVTPYSFYIHFPLGTSPLLEQQTKTMVAEWERGDSLWTFEQLQEDMNARYSMGLHQQRQGSLLAEGELVAACYSRDDRWYRALVLKTNSARNYVAVFYVDFGNSEEVPEVRVRSLSLEFTHLPFQAVECRLSDVSAVAEEGGGVSSEDSWREGIAALTELVKDRVLVARIVRPFPVAGMEVELYDTTDSQCDIHINKKMVDLGHLAPSSVPSSSECQPTLSLDPPRKRNSARAAMMLPG